MIRFATIGTNFITEYFLDAAKRVDDFELRGIYSRSAVRAEEFAVRFGAGTTYHSLQAITDDTYVDAVYIASPNAYHKEQVLKMLQCGKHVLVEKPAATNAADYEQMRRTACEKNLVLLEGMRPLFTPGFAQIEALLPQLGKIRRVTLCYCQYSSRYDAFLAGEIKNAFNPELGNSALLDLGVYCVEVLIKLFGVPTKVQNQNIYLNNGFLGAGTILAMYDDMLAEILYSKLNDSDRGSEIQGEKGSLYIDDICNPSRLILKLRSGEPLTVEVDTEFFGMRFELEAFIRMVSGRKDYLPYCENTLNSLRIMDLAAGKVTIN